MPPKPGNYPKNTRQYIFCSRYALFTPLYHQGGNKCLSRGAESIIMTFAGGVAFVFGSKTSRCSVKSGSMVMGVTLTFLTTAGYLC